MRGRCGNERVICNLVPLDDDGKGDGRWYLISVWCLFASLWSRRGIEAKREDFI